ncbi:hypothetical protein B0T17DRAFT_658322 [Bombardia bombarda]|uniref:MARVEL domain-containing protein n=1 Tax=Bombardia bombarda TaxID=252184 RepID=A0AA39WBS2_9PEZI|nr:hypothetical protein B0T17DRAFT_658322 [Bombardia bombarda]
MYSFIPLIHLVAAVFSIIELGLMAYGIRHPLLPPLVGSPSVESFMLFNAIWSLVVLVYVGLTPLYYARVFHGLAAVVLEWITMIFWFAGSVAFAVFWGAPSCRADTYCGSVEAAIAFGFFLWALFLVLVVIDTIEVMRARGHHTNGAAASHHHTKPYVGA